MTRSRILVATPGGTDTLSPSLHVILSAVPEFSVETLRLPLPPAQIARSLDRLQIAILVAPSRHTEESLQYISLLREKREDIPIVVVSDVSTPADILIFIQHSIADYIIAPLRPIDVLPRIRRIIALERESGIPSQTLLREIGLKQLLGNSPAFRRVTDVIPTIASSDVGVYLSGETGSGKEMCARVIHYISPRKDKPFIPIDCGGIPVDLVENELFGHVKGAFTGAGESFHGLVGEADGGTLFLDEIDCLPPPAQAKILRLLQEKEYRRLGSGQTLHADVRIIAATNINLADAVRSGNFRQDLFYRLNIIHLELPPLRERKEDIPLLSRHFLRNAARQLNKEISDFTDEAMSLLCSYAWPGNVRELENIVTRAAVFETGSLVRSASLALPLRDLPPENQSFRSLKAKVLADFEGRYLREILRAHGGNITTAAQAAQKNRRAFWELLRKNNIHADEFRSRQMTART